MITKKRAAQMVEDLNKYAAEVKERPWSNCDEYKRYERDAEALARLIERDELDQIAHTAISLQDVEKAKAAYIKAKEAKETPSDQRRTLDRVRSCHSVYENCKRYHRSAEEIADALQAFETARTEYESTYTREDSDAMHEEEAAKYERMTTADRIYRAARRVYVEQCAAVLAAALLERSDEWTKRPTHYKATRESVQAIADSVLIGTGCRAQMYENGDLIAVNMDWATTAKLHEYHDTMELNTTDTDEGGIMRITADTWRYILGSSVLGYDLAYIRTTCRSYARELAKIRALHDQYTQKVRDICEPFALLSMADDLKRAAKVYC